MEYETYAILGTGGELVASQYIELRCGAVDYGTFTQSVAAAENIYIGTEIPQDVLAVVPQGINLYALYVFGLLFHNLTGIKDRLFFHFCGDAERSIELQQCANSHRNYPFVTVVGKHEHTCRYQRQ
jgi:hypothetical protein